MKTALTGLMFIGYLLFYGAYIWMAGNIPLSPEQQKLFNYYPITLLFISIILFEYLGIESYIQQTFITAAKSILIFTFITIILNYHLLITGVYSTLGIIYGATLIVTVFIEISGFKHGIFNRK